MFSFFNIKSKPSAEEKLLKEKINNYTRLSLKNMSDKFEIAKGISQYDEDSKVTFETIDTLPKLKCLLEALL